SGGDRSPIGRECQRDNLGRRIPPRQPHSRALRRRYTRREPGQQDRAQEPEDHLAPAQPAELDTPSFETRAVVHTRSVDRPWPPPPPNHVPIPQDSREASPRGPRGGHPRRRPTRPPRIARMARRTEDGANRSRPVPGAGPRDEILRASLVL